MRDSTDDEEAEVHAALERALAEAVNAPIIRWVVGIEILDTDGVRKLWGMSHEGARAWDTLGLLEYLKAEELASIAHGDE